MPPNLEIMKEPKCLIDTGPDGKVVVNSEVLNELTSLDNEVVVVSIAGPYRTGKSFLMNKLYGQNKGFPLGPTVQPQTKGIWVWAREHPIHRDKYLILLDTEGLGDVEKGDENHDNQILCLAILLASTFVYNVMGVIGNDAILKLHFITELAKHLQVRSNSSSSVNKEGSSVGDDSNFDFYFPDFVYAIRDFTLELVINRREVTPDEYLEHTLTMKSGDRPEVKNYNKIRSCIRKYFKKRKCFTFIPPVAGKCRLLDEVPDENLLPEFRSEADAFVKYILQEAPIKQIAGRKLTGRMLGSLTQVYVEQMRTGMPYVENAVDIMAHRENSRAKEKAVQHYYDLMLQSLTLPVLEDAEFSQCHNSCLEKAIKLFLSKAVFDQNHTFQKQMNDEVEVKYKDLVKMNEDVCRKACQEALDYLYNPIRQKLASGHYTRSGGFRLYKDDMKGFEATYLQENGRLAEKMRHVLLEFLHARQTEEDAILRSDEMVTAAEKQAEAERQRAIEMEQRKMEAERQAQLQQQLLQDQQQAYQENIEQLQVKMREEAGSARKHYEDMIEKSLAEQQRLLSEGFQRESNQMSARISELQTQVQQLCNRPQPKSRGWCIIS